MVARIRDFDAQICESTAEDKILSLVRAREASFAELMGVVPKTGAEARAVLRQVAADMKFFELESGLLRPMIETLGNAPPFPAWELPGEGGA